MSTGNQKSIYSCLGASSHSITPRAEYDFYATHPSVINSLVENEEHITFKNPIWECACGQGHLSKRLETYGYTVRSTDLIDRGYGEGGIDFLQQTEKWNGTILTNPPYKYAQEFVEHSLDLIAEECEVWMFLKLTFLESIKRKAFFKEHPPYCVYVFSKRVPCAINGDFEYLKKQRGSAVAFAWYQWKKNYKGETKIKWL